MKSKLYISRLVVIGLLFGMSFSASAQQPGFREDGDPIFNDFYTGFDPGIVLADSNDILQLAPIIGDTAFAPVQSWKLDGISWQYDNSRFALGSAGILNHAVDVDDISAILGEPVYLITDQGNNKIIQYSVNSQNVIWNYSPANTYTFPTDACFYQETIGGTAISYALITWSGSNVVSKVSMGQTVVWQFGVPSTNGIGNGLLSSPSDAEKIIGTNEIIIADKGNKRVIIVDETQPTTVDSLSIKWQYLGPDMLFSPVDVQYITDAILGDQILVTDQTAHRVFLISHADSTVTWSFGDGTAGNDSTHLRNPADADWNPLTRRVVIADKGNNRVIEVSPEDSTYFYVWPNEVTSVDDVDPLASGGFLVCNKIPFNDDFVWVPSVLEFSTEPKEFESPVFDLGHDVDFETLTWLAHNITANTQVQFQFRSSSSYPNAGLAWLGPDGTPSTYYSSIDSILFAGHKIHHFFQVKARLITTDGRLTPVVDNVRVSYNYYDITQRPHVFSRLSNIYPIGAAPGAPVAVNWKSLDLGWKPAEEERFYLSNLAFIASLTNADAPDRTLLNIGPLPVTFELTPIPLSGYSELIGIQRLGLVITLISYNTALTPRLDNWRVTWQEKGIGTSAVNFVDAAGQPQPFYTAATYVPASSDSIFSDQTYVQLVNVLEQETNFNIEVVSNLSLDVEQITVTRDTSNVNYSAPTGILTIIVAQPAEVTINNDTLEVYDRDTLSARFQSALRPTEILTDSIQVVQGMVGQLFAENVQRQSIGASELNQRVYARVTNELDRSLDLVAQDTITVSIINTATDDSETLPLFEEQGQTGQFDSGEFVSQNGILLRDALNYTPNDGIIYARPNDIIQVVYQDNFKKLTYPTRQFVSIPDSIVIQMAQSLVCQVAPNPYYSSGGSGFRMRMGSSLGNVTVQKLEVFNLSGDKVAEFRDADIRFAEWGGNVIPVNEYGHINNWWNLQSDSDHPVSSGTYWVKAHAEVANATTLVVDKLTTLTKFVVIR